MSVPPTTAQRERSSLNNRSLGSIKEACRRVREATKTPLTKVEASAEMRQTPVSSHVPQNEENTPFQPVLEKWMEKRED